MTDVFVHDLALCDSDDVGAGTRIWPFAHVMAGAQLGENCNIGERVFVETGAVIGNGVIVKNGVSVWAGVALDDNVFVGPDVVFTNDKTPRSRHLADVPAVTVRYADDEKWLTPIKIEAGASLGAGAVILPSVTVGTFAMVAAGAVVTKDVAPHALVKGNPARQDGWVCFCGRPVADMPDGDCQNCPGVG